MLTLRERLRLAVVADNSALGLREQHAALRLLEVVGGIAGPQAQALGLLELIKLGLGAVTKTLLSTADVQTTVPPVSPREHEHAAVLPSGVPLPSAARPALGSASTAPECGTVYSRHVADLLQSSLCAATRALGLPGVCDALPLAAVGEELLTAALRAALRCVRLSQMSLGAEERPAALGAAQTSLTVFAAFALHAATAQLDALRHSMVLFQASDQRSRRVDAERTPPLRLRLQTHANELRRLPSALQLWAEGAMDEAALDDAPTRRAILAPLADVSARASHGVAAAEQLAAAAVGGAL